MVCHTPSQYGVKKLAVGGVLQDMLCLSQILSLAISDEPQRNLLIEEAMHIFTTDRE